MAAGNLEAEVFLKQETCEMSVPVDTVIAIVEEQVDHVALFQVECSAERHVVVVGIWGIYYAHAVAVQTELNRGLNKTSFSAR